MNDYTTTEKEKSRIQEGLRYLLLVSKLLEEAGLMVVCAEADYKRKHSILFSENYSIFRKWAKRRGLNVTMERIKDEETGLNWKISTEIHGIVIHSYMSDREKESYDAEAEAEA